MSATSAAAADGNHSDRTYTDDAGVAPRPPERGTSPPPIPTNAEFATMTPEYIWRWVAMVEALPGIIQEGYVGSTLQHEMHRRLALAERDIKGLPPTETGRQLRTRASDYRQWIDVDIGTGGGWCDTAEDGVVCNCQPCKNGRIKQGRDRKPKYIKYRRLYGTRLYLGEPCLRAIERGHMPETLQMPGCYGVADLKDDCYGVADLKDGDDDDDDDTSK